MCIHLSYLSSGCSLPDVLIDNSPRGEAQPGTYSVMVIHYYLLLVLLLLEVRSGIVK